MEKHPETVTKENRSRRDIQKSVVTNAIGWAMFAHRRADESDTEVDITDEETARCEEATSNVLRALRKLGYHV